MFSIVLVHILSFKIFEKDKFSFLEPDVFPIVNITTNTSYSLKIDIIEKPLEHLLNGILRFISVLYNITSATDLELKQCNFTLIINHTLFLEDEKPFSFLLKNLTAYTNYSLQLAYVTVQPGNLTRVIHQRTPIDSKSNIKSSRPEVFC